MVARAHGADLGQATLLGALADHRGVRHRDAPGAGWPAPPFWGGLPWAPECMRVGGLVQRINEQKSNDGL